MDRETYESFWKALTEAEEVPRHSFEVMKCFEGCLPVEVIAKRGIETLTHGPMKPVGLIDPATGTQPYAVVQLRREDRAGILYNIVGFQTKMTWPEQRRVFRMIPGLENAEFARYGSIHRNTFLNAPALLDATLQLRSRPGLFFAGQITGVEGYVESAAMGLLAGIHVSGFMTGSRGMTPAATGNGPGSPCRPSAESRPQDLSTHERLLRSLPASPRKGQEKGPGASLRPPRPYRPCRLAVADQRI